MPIENNDQPRNVGQEKAKPSGTDTTTDVTYEVTLVDISPEEGEAIVNIAATWEGTLYALLGEKSEKNVFGDCSGSTFHIYNEAGFPYGAYKATGSFSAYVKSKESRFRKVSLEEAQAGDIILWKSHMAIYSSKNSMWTAFNTSGKPYGKSDYKYWGKITGVYRYQKEDKMEDKNEKN